MNIIRRYKPVIRTYVCFQVRQDGYVVVLGESFSFGGAKSHEADFIWLVEEEFTRSITLQKCRFENSVYWDEFHQKCLAAYDAWRK